MVTNIAKRSRGRPKGFIPDADALERVTAELQGLLVRGDEKDGLFDAVKP